MNNANNMGFNPDGISSLNEFLKAKELMWQQVINQLEQNTKPCKK